MTFREFLDKRQKVISFDEVEAYAEMRVKEVVDGLPDFDQMTAIIDNSELCDWAWKYYDLDDKTDFNDVKTELAKAIVERLGKGRDET